MSKWKYKILSRNLLYRLDEEKDKAFEQELNKLGNECWELVEILPIMNNGNLIEARLILKRQVNHVFYCRGDSVNRPFGESPIR
jgi:hypothetical protein